MVRRSLDVHGFIQAPLGGLLPQTSEIPPPNFLDQVYNSIKNPVIAVIKRATVIQVFLI